MAIWRGVGGAGDATVDATNEAAAAVTAANNAATSASAAASSATSAATSATNAATSETNASTSATSAASSATSATSSATTATTQASNASTSATSAASSASAASTSATAAAASETAAATSETNAATSETNAATSETNAASSATSASTSASNASTSEANASTSASNASTSETNAANSATAAASSSSSAGTYATNAATSATAAASSASAASTSASNASTSETNAATSESNASTSASNASTSETNAASSATAAASSATSAAASYDSFDDRYLGAKSSAPTVDNDGDALLTGALYYNTTTTQLYIWNGSAWDDAAFSASGSVTSFNTRTGAVTLSATDVNTALGSDAVLDSDIGSTVQAYDATIVVDADIGSTVQAYSSVLQNTTASYTTAEETKLAGIEALADVTDATNVAAAGAVMESDTSTVSMSFVIDEDTMVSDSATKVPTQQSVKAYVDSQIASNNELNEVTDVTITTPADNEVLAYDSTSSNWINQTAAEAGLVATSDIGSTVQAYSSVLQNTTASYTTAEETKLAGIETAADVTDTTNVTAAGALMDSELTSEASVKALNQGVATTDSPTFASLTLTTDLSVSDGGTGASSFTANNVLLGNGTSALQTVAPSTSGNILTSNGTTWVSQAPAASGGFDSGTLMVFQQTAAPTGWTKQTTHDNKAFRVVSGTASSGGSVAFSTAFASQTPTGSVSISSVTGSAGNTTLSTPQIPAHNHTRQVSISPTPPPITNGNFISGGRPPVAIGANPAYVSGPNNNTGGGGSHSHPFSFSSGSGTFSGNAINLAVQYVDLIIASKD